MSEQHVSLTHNGGWKFLFDIAWSVSCANFWNLLQTVLLGLILWRLA